MSRSNLLKPARLFHLYSGVFFTPALLFFAFTGFLQTFSFHETTRGSSYQPPSILVRLGQLHKKQTLVVPANKLHPPDKPAGLDKSASPDAQNPDAPTPGKSHKHAESATPGAAPTNPQPEAAPAKAHNLWPMKIFFGCAAIALFLSTLTGLYMSYSYVRNKPAITATLAAGIVIPLLLLLF